MLFRSPYADGSKVVDSSRRVLGVVTMRLPLGGSSRLVGRFGASSGPSRLQVVVDGREGGVWDIPKIEEGTWQDLSVPLTGGGPAEITLVPVFEPREPFGGWNVARFWVVGK